MAVQLKQSCLPARTQARLGGARPLPLRLRPVAAQQKDAVVQQESMQSVQERLMAPLMLAATAAPVTALAAHADEAVAAAPEAAGGWGPAEITIAVAPIVFYALFSVYREKFNPRATLLDGAYIAAALVVFANIFSILIFKVRFF